MLVTQPSDNGASLVDEVRTAVLSAFTRSRWTSLRLCRLMDDNVGSGTSCEPSLT